MGSVILGSLDPSATAFYLIRQLLQDWGRSHLFVTAAGNDRQLLNPQGLLLDEYYFLPAQLNLSNMLVVGATGEHWVPAPTGVWPRSGPPGWQRSNAGAAAAAAGRDCGA